MKISIFAPLFGKVGVEDAMLSLAGEMTERGNKVELLQVAREWNKVGATGSITKHRFLVAGIAYRLPHQGRVLYRIVSAIVALMIVLPLAFYLRRKKPDALIAVMMPLVAVLTGWISMSPTNVIVSVQGYPRGGFLRRTAWRLVAKLSDGIVAESGEIADALAEVSGIERSSIRTIHNPHLDPTAEQRAEGDSSLWSQMPAAEFSLLAVGRLTRQKGFDTLVKAFADVATKADARLLVLGEGEQRDVLERLATNAGLQDRILFGGHVADPYPYIKRADLLVVSSRWEGLARVPIEAQSLGTPVVSTDIPGGMREIVLNGEAGLLVKPDDPTALSAGILQLLRDERLRQRLAATALANVQRFSPAACADSYLDLIESLQDS